MCNPWPNVRVVKFLKKRDGSSNDHRGGFTGISEKWWV
jgi:hypothetical protein